MSVRTRVGMVAALGAATSLLLAVALTQAATQDARFDREPIGASDGTFTYVPLEGIAAPDPLTVASTPAVDEPGETIGDDGTADAQPPADAQWTPKTSPPLWEQPTDPYLGNPQTGDPTPRQPRTPEPPAPDDSGGSAPSAPAPQPTPGGAPVIAEPDAAVAPTEEPVDPKTGGEETAATSGPVPPTAVTGGASAPPTAPTAPTPPDTGAVDGAAAPEGGVAGEGSPAGAPASEEPAEELPSTDVIEGVEPPPAELLPTPESAS